jgi:hypothetical protein
LDYPDKDDHGPGRYLPYPNLAQLSQTPYGKKAFMRPAGFEPAASRSGGARSIP